MDSLDGKPVDLSKYKGEVVLIVNVASKCGLTPQYKQLEEVYSKYKGKGFEVLGFPANEFGKQEPGSNTEISTFCTEKYGVDFPMFSKIVVKGDGHPPAVRLPDLERDQSGHGRRDQMELREVPGRPRRQGGQAVRSPHQARRSGSAPSDRRRAGQKVISPAAAL